VPRGSVAARGCAERLAEGGGPRVVERLAGAAGGGEELAELLGGRHASSARSGEHSR
jgi:hypothetical protein